MSESKHKHKKFLIFDIETIPDEDIADNLYDIKFANDVERRAEMAKKFPKHPFHKILCISMMIAVFSEEKEQLEIKRYRCFGLGDIVRKKEKEEEEDEKLTEEDMISKFFDVFRCYKNICLVTFNGRGFDVPVMKYRAMKHNLNCSHFYDDDSASYLNRYGKYDYQTKKEMMYHYDLMDLMADYGQSKCKLQDLCYLFNFAGKLGMDGSQVLEEYEKGNINDIKNYCDIDVLNTYLVLLRFLRHRNELSKKEYDNSIEYCKGYLKINGIIDKPHFLEYLKEWDKCEKK